MGVQVFRSGSAGQTMRASTLVGAVATVMPGTPPRAHMRKVRAVSWRKIKTSLSMRKGREIRVARKDQSIVVRGEGSRWNSEKEVGDIHPRGTKLTAVSGREKKFEIVLILIQ